MSRRAEPPAFLWELFQDLRRRQFLLGTDDWTALWLALRAGFGWGSRQALLDLCTSLWATSQREAEILRSRFPQDQLPDWDVATPLVESPRGADVAPGPLTGGAPGPSLAPPPPAVTELQMADRGPGALPPLPPSTTLGAEHRFVFLPDFPVSERQVAQAWRRLRRPVRAGPPTELDIDATLERRLTTGVATPPVLIPRRRNTSRLLILVDRQGSMAPYHGFVDQVCATIDSAASLQDVDILYFHDVPAEGADDGPIRTSVGGLARVLDDALPHIEPLTDGVLFTDRACRRPRPIADVLGEFGAGGAALLISDAGAARGNYDVLRLLDTVAFLKGLREQVPFHAWLNPVAHESWKGSTAAQLARHSPLFPLTDQGMHAAVDVLRGRPVALERPL